MRDISYTLGVSVEIEKSIRYIGKRNPICIQSIDISLRFCNEVTIIYSRALKTGNWRDVSLGHQEETNV